MLPAAFALPLVFISTVLGLGVGFSACVEMKDGIDGNDTIQIMSNVLVVCLCAMMIVASWYALAASLL